ncbi:MFS transporter [Microbacterium sp. zg.Y625]|uniref:MFS transporter n=1 Tax=Microbacterium jiangjiandongii TaxID=3049071 RepID=UPI00214C098B|nr:MULTISPECIES: MFS transporter [unclassified Microbacterium]MCR2792741.1 MFS transporter [Microbacterium sp. zg.Y625]WIM26719.1 MFS transporter [Microbacterium sp. zg-Y625]
MNESPSTPPGTDALPSPTSASMDGAAAIGEGILTPTDSLVARARVSAGYIWLLVLATLGSYAALVAPIGISLSLRVQELAPENTEWLGYVVGAGAIAATISQPLVGMWSDRTRSGLGRRRPFAIGGTLLGLTGLALMAVAPSVPLLAAAWVVTQLGWATVLSMLLLSQADRLPEEQRGKVAGLSGFTTMIASVLGVGIASAFIGNNFLVFLVPGALGAVGIALWVILVKEPSSRDIVVANKLTVVGALRDMGFNPKRYPDFAWNWFGRLFFNFGVTFATTFTTLFFASRLSEGGRVADIGGIIVILSLFGVLSAAGGAMLGGFLSDKVKRRRIFVLLAGIAFTAGALMMAFGGSDVVVLFTGSIVANIGLGVFSAVDQAIVLDVLPERDTNAGRFIGINGYSSSIAQGLAPIAAAPLLLIGVTGADKNYGLVLVIAAACTLIGGTVVMLKVRGTK